MIANEGRLKFLWISQEQKSETVIAHENKTKKYAVNTCQNVSCLMRYQLPLNNIFCPTPPPLIRWRLKHRQRAKINKTILSASPSPVFHTKFIHNIRIEKQISKYSIVTATEPGHPTPRLGLKILCPQWFSKQISQNGDRKLAYPKILYRVPLDTLRIKNSCFSQNLVSWNRCFLVL